jgi:esterase/lipase
MKVYFISGLAADNRVFKFIKLPAGFEAVYLDWIKPVDGENLREYAIRLGSKIDISEPFYLVGLSMGGMMASEICCQLSPVKTILISSVPLREEFPPYTKAVKYLKLHKIIPARVFKSASIMKRIFTKETPEVKKILKEVIRASDENFIRWSLDAIVNWDNKEKNEKIVQIHGSRDELLPLKYTKPDYVIKNGTHLMVLSKANEISDILKKILVEQ